MMNNQNGAIAILTAILLTTFLGFVALSVDTGYLVAGRNELQNAADAGALAGARELYNLDGTSVNENCNKVAYDTALKNISANLPVEVNWTSGNTGDIQRGHWSWGRGDRDRGFTPNDSLAPIILWGVSDADLDDDLDFINAVQVTTRREVNPITTFFGKIFGIDSFIQSTTATGYIGFAGSFKPQELDAPIAICLESITYTDLNGDLIFDCSIGRMINSSGKDESSNTGAWTDFEQDPELCKSGTNADVLKTEILGDCNASGNPFTLVSGQIAATGGQTQSVYDKFYECWENATNKQTSWEVKMPVVICEGQSNIKGCLDLVGAVTIEIVWISGGGEDPQKKEVPTQMDDWSNDSTDGEVRWSDFVSHFGLHNVDGSDAPYDKKSIYFKPSCEAAVPSGGTGGKNLGVLARVPVLVK